MDYEKDFRKVAAKKAIKEGSIREIIKCQLEDCGHHHVLPDGVCMGTFKDKDGKDHISIDGPAIFQEDFDNVVEAIMEALGFVDEIEIFEDLEIKLGRELTKEEKLEVHQNMTYQEDAFGLAAYRDRLLKRPKFNEI